MLIRMNMRYGPLLERGWKTVAALLVYTALVVWIHLLGHGVTIPTAIPALVGTLLSILLGFRTNSAYQRWWEARKVWGAIVNDSRTFARQVLAFFVPKDDESVQALQKELIYRQMAWNYALSRALRKQDPVQDLGPFLSPEEIDSLKDEKNVPNALLETQALWIASARARGTIDGFQQARIDATLTHLTDSMGKCERIKNTVFPTTYGYIVRAILWIFCLLLPLGLIDYMNWFALPVSFLLGSAFAMIEVVAVYLQDPFENEVSDTPTTALSRTIEINLRQQLGETDLPDPIQPVDGVLM